MTTTINAVSGTGLTQTSDGSGIVKLQSDGKTTNALAWVNFDGTTSPATIRSQYNVSSITRNSTGDYTVNFTNAMSDANYSVCGTASGTAYNGFIGIFPGVNPTASSVRIATQIYTNALVNQNNSCLAIFGN